jgi:hypothetical protein
MITCIKVCLPKIENPDQHDPSGLFGSCISHNSYVVGCLDPGSLRIRMYFATLQI